MVFCIISFLFVDLFDSIGVFLGVAPKAGLVDEQGKHLEQVKHYLFQQVQRQLVQFLVPVR